MYESVERVHKDTAASDLGSTTTAQTLYAHSRLNDNLRRIKPYIKKDRDLVRRLWFSWKSILKMPAQNRGSERLNANSKLRTKPFLDRIYRTGDLALEDFSELDPRTATKPTSGTGKNLDMVTQDSLRADYMETILKPNKFYSVSLRDRPASAGRDRALVPDSPVRRGAASSSLVNPDALPDEAADEVEPYYVVFEFLSFVTKNTKFVEPCTEALPAFINEMQVVLAKLQ